MATMEVSGLDPTTAAAQGWLGTTSPLTLPGLAETYLSQRARLLRRARTLVALALGWHATEAAVALASGIAAGSISLVGFGADVGLEAFGGMIVLWRLTAARAPSDRAERWAQRLLGVSFGLLAAYIALEALGMLSSGERPDASPLGIGLAIGALLLMPPLCAAKARVGRRLGSASVVIEGRQNLLCAYLSRALFLGLAANAVLGLWWADPVAALAISAIAVREGRRAWTGSSCCAGLPCGEARCHPSEGQGT
ncbi:MAG: cation transporter [Solirubrobacteraceae bacterium]|jgi:divalent metal cation (Fe/Co/Zn/Cd) transporter